MKNIIFAALAALLFASCRPLIQNPGPVAWPQRISVDTEKYDGTIQSDSLPHDSWADVLEDLEGDTLIVVVGAPFPSGERSVYIGGRNNQLVRVNIRDFSRTFLPIGVHTLPGRIDSLSTDKGNLSYGMPSEEYAARLDNKPLRYAFQASVVNENETAEVSPFERFKSRLKNH